MKKIDSAAASIQEADFIIKGDAIFQLSRISQLRGTGWEKVIVESQEILGGQGATEIEEGCSLASLAYHTSIRS